MESQKYQAFKKHAQEILDDNPEDIEVYLIKSNTSDDWGTLTIDSSEGQAQIENHCQQCFEEFYPFRFAGHKDFAYNSISIIASPAKFEALIAGKIKLPETLNLYESLAKK